MRISKRKVLKRKGKRETRRKRNAEQTLKEVSRMRMEIQRSWVAKKELFSSASLDTRFPFCKRKRKKILLPINIVISIGGGCW